MATVSNPPECYNSILMGNRPFAISGKVANREYSYNLKQKKMKTITIKNGQPYSKLESAAIGPVVYPLTYSPLFNKKLLNHKCIKQIKR